MNNKRVIIIIIIAVVILAMVELFSLWATKNPPAFASDSVSDSVQNTQEDFQKRNENLYDKDRTIRFIWQTDRYKRRCIIGCL